MLPARERLRRSSEFTATFRSGIRAGRPTLVVHAAAPSGVSEPTTCARVGFVVSKAVGPAVTRNRVKRRLRHLVAPLLRSPEVVNGTHFVVRALPAAATASSAELAADLAAAWSRVLWRVSSSERGET